MSNKQCNQNFSATITQFIQMMENAKKDYQWNCDEVGRMDALTQDYLHHLELDNLCYKERAKVATKLALCRQARRDHKDMTLALEPLVAFLESPKGIEMLKAMKEALGKTRKIEKYMETRQYHPRVLGKDD